MDLCYEISSWWYKKCLKQCQKSKEPRTSSPEAYWLWQFESSKEYFPKIFDLCERVYNKRVIDIGCGIGGRTCYLATKGLHSIVGIDINHKEIDLANEMADKRLSLENRKRVQFVKVKEHEKSTMGQFDIVLLIDCLEHVKDPVAILNYAYDLTRPGGVCYFSTVGWYNHGASHLTSIIPPFSQLFFSDKQILGTVRKIVSSSYYSPTMWDSNPPCKRWEGIDNLKNRPEEYLNKITIKGIKKAVYVSKFENKEIEVIPFSWKSFPTMRIFNFFARIPIIQEVYHSLVIGRLQRL